MKKFLLPILLFIASISYGQIRISGTVLEGTNKAPLSRAIITLNGSDNTLITDSEGYFTVVLKESGIYELSVSKNGYKTLAQELMLNESIEIQISLTSNEGTAKPVYTTTTKKETIEVNQNVLNTLSGSIRDKFTKEPINKAIISFEGIKKTYTTTLSGLFKIEIPAGRYFMQVTAKGFNLETADIPDSSDLDFTILMTKDSLKSFITEAVVISGTRATAHTPTTFTKITSEELNENNLGKDLPYLLELTPSVVASSDGGNGTGYTSMRIRGSDMTRINFTLNGFPVNDAESQGVFLVNTPDLASDASDIQIQRGIGTSTNGAGAFGASVNINTNKKRTKPYAEFYNSFGSFNTMKNTIKAGTGELFNHFTFDGRFSHIMTDGFIDRAEAKMFAYSLNAAYYNKNSVIRFNVFSGKEKTYQAWNGVNKDQSENDRTFNSAGTDYGQKEIPHDNETDNYNQDNYQLGLSHQFGNRISANLGFHYTKGSGYFEQYKIDEDLLEYGAASSTSSTDLIRRRWLKNDFFGTIFSVAYKAKNIQATLGGGWNQYDGDHFGEIIWAKEAKDIEYNQRYYDNNGLKTDFNTFLKAEYTLNRFVIFGDVQYRRVSYTVHGIDNDQLSLQEDADFNFINPKVGLTYIMGEKKNAQVYASFAMANREPTRNDFIDNDETPEAENMMDFELGYKTKSKKVNFGIDVFYMKYKNQLVLTGALNDVGSAVRANVDNSFRTGLEVELAYEPVKFFGLSTTATWSLNEIEEFTLVDYTETTITHDKTKISYSPAFTGNLSLYTKPFKGFKFGIINKFVSEQFLDNTTTKANTLAAYYLMDVRASYSIKPKFMNEIEFILKANNITNTKYSTNGYVFYDSPYFYPQAGTNFEGGINLKF
jgi:iron complex outermembrane receptor protein